MINHPTTCIEQGNQSSSSSCTIVLVGPPVSGKTTIRRLFADAGATTLDLGDYHDSGELVSGWRNALTSLASDTGVACIEGPITTEELSYIRETFDSVLVVRVHASKEQRLERCIDRLDGAVLSHEKIEQAHREALMQESFESPYPQHDVSMRSDESISMAALSTRCENIVAFARDTIK